MSFAWNDLVTLVNRTSTTLEVRADGATLVLKPHEEQKVPRFVAELACRQHPRFGTEDPYNPRDYEMLVGVREWKHDCSPIEQSSSVERLDRSALMSVEARKAEVIKGRAQRPARVATESQMPVGDVVFQRD